MREFIKIKTPENVTIEYELAGIGSRSLAVITDTFIRLLIYIGLMIPLFFMNVYQMGDFFTGWKIAIIIIAIFLINWGYYIFFEMIMKGKTPGKKLVGLRTVKENGRAINFFDSFIRNLFRIILDNYIGIIIMFISKRYKRLGDIAAGTIVIKERSMGKAITLQSIGNVNSIIAKQDSLNEEKVRITSKEDEIIKDFLARRYNLDGAVRFNLAGKLADYFLKKPELEGKRLGNSERVLEYVERAKEIID